MKQRSLATENKNGHKLTCHEEYCNDDNTQYWEVEAYDEADDTYVHTTHYLATPHKSKIVLICFKDNEFMTIKNICHFDLELQRGFPCIDHGEREEIPIEDQVRYLANTCGLHPIEQVPIVSLPQGMDNDNLVHFIWLKKYEESTGETCVLNDREAKLAVTSPMWVGPETKVDFRTTLIDNFAFSLGLEVIKMEEVLQKMQTA